MCGLFFGAIGFGRLSDTIGRRNGMLVSACLTFIGNLSLYWINNAWAYTFIRMLCGGFAHGGVIVSYVYIMEFMGPNARSWMACNYLTVFRTRLRNRYCRSRATLVLVQSGFHTVRTADQREKIVLLPSMFML